MVNVTPVKLGTNTRMSFGKIKEVMQMPNLIQIQKDSYQRFLDVGLKEVLRDVAEITDYAGNLVLTFVDYRMEDKPKYSVRECKERDATYAAPLRVTARLENKETGEIKESEIYMGDFPLMTSSGTFIIHGAERVIVSQLHRSPGISTERQLHNNGQHLLSVRIIPDRGNWIEIMFDTSDVMWCFMDQRKRRRKFYATTLLRAFGHGSDEKIMELFYTFKKLPTDEVYTDKDLRNLVMKNDLVDTVNQTVVARRFDQLTPSIVEQVAMLGIKSIEVVDVAVDSGTLIKTLREDAKSGIRNEDDALKEIYKRMRPGDPPNVNNAKAMIHRMFFEQAHYDLGYVGRHKINKKLGLSKYIPENLRTLAEGGVDVIEAIRLLLKIHSGQETIDDIDHLGNRRIRTTGELLENQCRVGLARTERLIRERMTVHDANQGVALTPSRLINSKTFSAVVSDFFARSQLSCARSSQIASSTESLLSK